MAIGVNWKEIWKPVWKTVWDQTGAAPETPIGVNWAPVWKQVWGPVWDQGGGGGASSTLVSVTAISGTELTLVWTGTASRYRLDGGTPTALPDGTSPDTISGLTPNTPYLVELDNGDGVWSNGITEWTDNTGTGGGGIGILVPLGALTLTGNAPTVTTGAGQFIAVPRGTLTLTGYAPTIIGTVVDDDGGAPHEDIDAANEEIIQMVAMILASGVLECH